jgi:hypothetical protein
MSYVGSFGDIAVHRLSDISNLSDPNKLHVPCSTSSPAPTPLWIVTSSAQPTAMSMPCNGVIYFGKKFALQSSWHQSGAVRGPTRLRHDVSEDNQIVRFKALAARDTLVACARTIAQCCSFSVGIAHTLRDWTRYQQHVILVRSKDCYYHIGKSTSIDPEVADWMSACPEQKE